MADRPLTEEREREIRRNASSPVGDRRDLNDALGELDRVRARCAELGAEADDLEAQLAEAQDALAAARAEAATLRAALAEAIDFAEEGWDFAADESGCYASDYFQTIARLRAVAELGGEDA